MDNYWILPGVPHKGWELQDVIDTNEFGYSFSYNNFETCMMCGNEHIRYVHIVTHFEVEKEFRVGCVCAEKMTEDYSNPKRMEKSLRNKFKRRINWSNANWQCSSKGNLYLKKAGHILTIFKDKRSDKFKCIIDDEFGTAIYTDIDLAKKALFNKIEDLKLKGRW